MNRDAAHTVRTLQMGGGEEKKWERKEEKETLWMLIAAAATDGGQGVFLFVSEPSVLIQPRPCGVSAGVSAAAAGPSDWWGRRGGWERRVGGVQYIQLLFHQTEAAPVSQSLEFCSFTEVENKHRYSPRNKETKEKQQRALAVQVLSVGVAYIGPPGTPRGALRQCKSLDDISLLLLL